ncbi:MAG: hypothetical protein ACLU3I_21110 [Acutalibacteraceae bacterium]
MTNGTKDGGFYAGADTFKLNCTGLTGEYSLVLLLAGDSAVPTEGNIQYIDQTSVESGKVAFTLKPKALTEGTYNVYISTTDKALEKVASFQLRREAAVYAGRCGRLKWYRLNRCVNGFAAYSWNSHTYRHTAAGSGC